MTRKLNPLLLCELREDACWSQEELAVAAGVSARTVQRLEKGHGASLETIKAVASALAVDASELTRRPQRVGYTAAFQVACLERLVAHIASLWRDTMNAEPP